MRTDMEENRGLTRQTALGGLLTAVILLLLIIMRLVPTGDLFFNFLMSLTLFISVSELGGAAALLVYLASGILGFLWPGPPYVLGFLICGGPYPIIKNIIEKKSTGRRLGRTAGLIFKSLSGLLLGLLYYVIMVRIFIPPSAVDRVMNMPLFKLWAIPLFLILFLIYDYLLTQGLDFYHQRIKRFLHKG